MMSDRTQDNDREKQQSHEAIGDTSREDDASGPEGDDPQNESPFDKSDDAGKSQHRKHIERSSDEPAPFELEDQDTHHAHPAADAGNSSHKDKEPETCPNCMAPMHERGALVCLRCGFDQRTLRVAKTRVRQGEPADDGDEHGDKEDEASEQSKPLCRTGFGGVQMPLAIAAVSGLMLLIGILAGWPGLFPSWVVREAGDDPISLLERAINVGRFLVLIALWTGCAIGGLYLLALTLQRPMGDLRLVAARMLGIIVAIRLVTFIHVPGPAWVEWMLETALQFGLFIGLGLAFFRLQPRDALTLGGWALLLVLVMWLFAHAVVWVH